MLSGITAGMASHLRRRRTDRKAELYDSLATMLDAGMPLHEAIATCARSLGGRRSGKAMLLGLAESVRGGSSLSEAMGMHGGWFDGAEVAMVGAGQAAGELSSVLRGLAERHQHAGGLSAKLVGALTYPALVACVGLGVSVFLSVKTLPELTGILVDAGVEVPRLTAVVMAIGQAVARQGWILIGGGLAALLLASILWKALRQAGWRTPRWVRALTPTVARRAACAQALLALAELVRAGVPLVEAIRIVAPTSGGIFSGSLRDLLTDAARRLEQGGKVSQVFDDGLWFTEEHRQLLAIGESSGELDGVLERIGQRELRSARRRIDRLATLLEPAAVLMLAAVVGVVVMAAILPLIRLQDIV